MTTPTHFIIGNLYTIDEVQRALGVGNAGGIRVATDTAGNVKRAVLLTSIPSARQASENPYHDRIEGDVLTYTGAGREGSQTLSGVNKRLPQQLMQNFPIYGFLLVGSRRDPSVGPRRWQFLGLLEHLRHYPDSQVDTKGHIRSVWIFELRIHAAPDVVTVADDSSVAERILSESRKQAELSKEDGELDDSVSGYAGQRPEEIEAIRSTLLAKPPRAFEHFVKDLLVLSGFVNVSVTKFSQDGGIDVCAFAGGMMWPIEKLMLQVQAKRWLHSVGRKEVAELRGSLEPFARGAIVTTSHYSRAAMIEATAPGKAPIVLVDGYSLAKTVRQLGMTINGDT